MKHFFGRMKLSTATMLMFVSQAGLVYADSAPGPDQDVLEEITVTALKRSSTVQETPVSITALTGSHLDELGVQGIQDYFRQIPNMNMTSSGSGYQRLSFRGVQAAGEATTGVYYDETPVTGPTGTAADPGAQQPNLDLFDVERIEALRGPQGTLYGSGSMGGTLRILYNKPDTHEYSGRIEGQYTGMNDGSPGHYIKAMANVPLIDGKLGARVVLSNEHVGGFIDNVTLGRSNVNQWNNRSARTMLRYTPTSTLTLDATAIYQNSESADSTSTWLNALGGYKIDTASLQPSKKKLDLYNLTAHWKLPFAELTGTASHYEWDTLDTVDYGGIYNLTAPYGCPLAYPGATSCTPDQKATYLAGLQAVLPQLWYTPAYLKVWTAEGRLTSTGDGPLDWTVGYFYEDRKDYMDSIIASADRTTGVLETPFTNLTFDRYVRTQQIQKAEFGQIGYHILSNLAVSAGGRHYSYAKTVAGEILESAPYGGSVPTPYSQVDVSASGWVYRFNATYNATSNLMLYTTVASGFRPGGANNTPGVSTSSIFPYKPDKVVSYEMGMKSSWLEQRLTANVAAFLIDWTDMQVQGISTNGSYQIITNAGKARLTGGELELMAVPIERLHVSVGAGLVHAVLTQDQAGSTLIATGTTGITGDRIPNVPHATGSVEVSYRYPLTSTFNGMALLNYSYTGKSTTDLRPDYPYNEKQGDFGLANARVGVEAHDMGVYLFVNNLFDTAANQSANTLPGAWERRIVGPPPLTFGVNVRKEF
jgi:outer membrane receptor protein involved in Fe transport